MNNNFPFLSFPGNAIAQRLFQKGEIKLPFTALVTLKHQIFTKNEANIGEIEITFNKGTIEDDTINFSGLCKLPLLQNEVSVKGEIDLNGKNSGGYMELENESDFEELTEKFRIAGVEVYGD
jgi:hypothetical protein